MIDQIPDGVDFRDLVAHYAEAYRAVGAVDRGEMEAAMCELYAVAGQDRPDIVWCASPMAAFELASAEERTSFWHAYWYTVRYSFDEKMKSLRPRVARELASTLLSEVGNSEKPHVILDELWGSRVTRSVDAAAAKRGGDAVIAAHFGQDLAGWVAHQKSLVELGVDLDDVSARWLDALDTLTAMGWSFIFSGVVFMCERASVAHYDTQIPGRPHNYDGPALVYPDGKCVYALHGECVPERVVTAPDTLTWDDLQRENNISVVMQMVPQYLSRGDAQRRELAIALKPNYYYDLADPSAFLSEVEATRRAIESIERSRVAL